MVHAVRTPTPIRVDGRLDDVGWQQAQRLTGFIQRLPDEGKPALGQTELQIAYDDDAIYVGARLLDHEPSRIVRRLTRRDVAADADRFSIFFDPHHDHLTGVEFRVSAAGVQRDAVIYNDVYQDDTWDAVWDSAVGMDDRGWTVEMRIPFSQLRFPQADVLVWGVNAQRIVHRTGEESWLSITPSNESGLASRMPHLDGLSGIPPARHLELLPYVTARTEYVDPPVSGNPFNDGSRAFAGAGLDLKYGVASNLTLDATVNPDFGQVEVDPAVVNLSASETFFEEKRPFFTEGSQILSRFGKSGASEYWSYFFFEPQLFYSRRIGRSPQAPAPGPYVDTPTTTTILGAAKLTGKTRRGWTLGVMEAVTGREYSRVSDGFVSRDDVQAEPLTNYFVGRAQHSLGSRASLGLLTTMVHREAGHAGTGRSPRGTGLCRRTRRPRVPRSETRLGDFRGPCRKLPSRDRTGNRSVATSVTALSATAGRPESHVRPDTDVALRLDRQPQSESQPRQRHRQRRAVGDEPGLRLQRRRVHDAGRSRRRPRPGPLPQAHARPVHADAAAGRREVVDVELGRRLAGRRRAGDDEPAVPQLLALQPHARMVEEHVGRPAHARRADDDPPRHQDREHVRRQRHAAAILHQRVGRHLASATSTRGRIPSPAR